MLAAKERIILKREELEQALERLAQAIEEGSADKGNLALVGIETRGVALANRLADKLRARLGRTLPSGSLDITLYRDDFKLRRKLAGSSTKLGFDIGGKDIVLVDDVIFSGRTIRAALDALADYGRAASIRLAVLLDRGHRELPIAPDFVGVKIASEKGETVRVRLTEVDGKDEVVSIRR
jgi:pyrimidine operon attenuation protein/uracil phosphoribosyltransferase